MNVEDLLEAKFKDVRKMSRKELEDELSMFRNLWSWMNNEVKYYITKVGQQCRVYLRIGEQKVGTLLQPVFHLHEVEIGIYVKVYDYLTGKYFIERKIDRIPASNIVMFEFITERDLALEEEMAKAISEIEEEIS